MGSWLFRVVKGAFIGTGAILPGISGGVLMVVLGVYRPVMAFLAHPVKEFRRHFALLLPVILGFLLGIVVLSRGVDWLFRTSEVPAVWLFIGLVMGTLPSIYQEAGKKGRSPSCWAALLLGFVLMGAWMFYLSRQGAQVEPSALWWALCGVLWGLGIIVPGMSPSSFFLFFGLYQPMTAGIGALDFSVILPMAAGLLCTIALLARAMNALLRRAYAVVMHAILGIVIASTLAILPLGQGAGFWDALLYALCFVVGWGAAYGMDRMSQRLKPAD